MSRPSTATSGPGTKDSTSNRDRSSSSPAPADDGPHPLDCGRELPGVVGADHPRLADIATGLTTQGNGTPVRSRGPRRSATRNSGTRTPAAASRARARSLRHERPGRSRRVSGEAELARHPPGQLHRRVVRGHHRGKPALASGSGPDRLERPLRIAEVDPQATLRGHRVLALGHHEEPRPETGRGAEIRRDPIASRRRDEERRAAERDQAWAAPHPVQPPLPPVAMNTLLNTKLEPVGRVTKSISTPRR